MYGKRTPKYPQMNYWFLKQFLCVPDGDFHIFLKQIGNTDSRKKLNGKRVLLRGDWNINLIEDSARL